MKNKITELVFILDKSGSMAGLESDTVGGFNAMIEKQKKRGGRCYVTTVLFNNESETLHDRIELGLVPKMTEADYCAGGTTALVDAVADTVTHIAGIHKYQRTEDVPERTVFVITTDGQENSSRRHTAIELRELIWKYKSERGWEFLFIGANIDSVSTAEHYGIDKDRAVDYSADPKGTEVLYSAVSDTICRVREGKNIDPEWSRDIKNDYGRRKKK